LRNKFNEETTDNTLQEKYVKNDKVFKILMLHYPNFEIFGAALYKEDKNDGNNLCKIELFCAERENKGIGSRLMINLIHYMTCKKFYSEVFIEADLFAV
jgi:hypothetical protein